MSWRPAPCWGWNVLADVWLEDRLKHKQTEEVKLRCYLYKLCIILRYLNSFLAWSLGSSILEHPPRYELQDIWSKKERLIKDVSHIPFHFDVSLVKRTSLESTLNVRSWYQKLHVDISLVHVVIVSSCWGKSRAVKLQLHQGSEFAEESTSKLPFNDDISNGIYIFMYMIYIHDIRY